MIAVQMFSQLQLLLEHFHESFVVPAVPGKTNCCFRSSLLDFPFS